MLLLLLACAIDPKPDDSGNPADTADSATDTDTAEPVDVDADDDGWTVEAGDCDDNDPGRFPGNPEVCDGGDQNCDDIADEGFGDGDEDGTPDCLDVEECDGLDNDGDGGFDEDFTDTDGDGWADCVEVEDCDGVDNDGDTEVDEGFDGDADGFASCFDCNDADDTVYPGAPEPGDGRDHDCDGLVDDDAWAAGDLAIVEVMVNPQDLGDPDGEWIEIVNTSGRALPLDGVSVWSGTEEYVLDAGRTLDVGERLVIGGSAKDWIDVVWEGVSLGNGADAVELYAGAVRLDGLAWDDGITLPDVAGASLSLDPWYGSAQDNDVLDRWCASTLPWGGPGTDAGTPGASNEPCTTIDHDFDGLSVDGGDCDDDDNLVYPGAPDAWYDGIDSDCDTWSDYDADRDGYDSDAYSGDDCDDAAAGTNPGATEVCDAADTDEDCDGGADDADDAPTSTSTRYYDADGDGYGDADVSAEYCDPPTEWVASDEDCEDALPDVNPDAVEVCGNGVDDDCDGTTNGCGPGGQVDIPDAGTALLGESADDEAGLGLDYAGDVDADGIVDIAVGAFGSDRGASGGGALYLIVGEVTGEISLSDADLILTGESANDQAGAEVDGIGDFDGDGVPDLLVGAGGDDDGGVNAGAAYVVSGALRGESTLADATVKLIGENANDAAGTENVGLGDLDGDGFTDIAVGVLEGDAGGTGSGVVYLVDGGLSGSVDLSAADGKLVGEDREDDAGATLALAGDIDGDGVSDLLVGAPYDDDGGSDAGAVYLVYLPVTGTLDLSAADAKITGERTQSYLSTVAGPGDLDGDGREDIAVGSTESARRGMAYVFTTVPSGSVGASTADVQIMGAETDDAAAVGLAGAGDMDGDGVPELLIGANGVDDGQTEGGAVYLWPGLLTAGSYDLADAETAWWGAARGDEIGAILAGGVDHDGDGYDDALVGARSDDTTDDAAGAAYLVFGGVGW